MQRFRYSVHPDLKTAALDGALLVFCPGSGATVALADDLLRVFNAIATGADDETSLVALLTGSADEPLARQTQLDHCLRLLLQQQLILPVPA